ncbi:hypothetical protein HHI36_008439 [Cryptolaemus montrouzieri]|uniref:Transcription factor Adf-1 n=1 Tax=Cryptolaemus montrouzieri TaxID=559131 RepID=A0ABD2MSL5_9CUCU
MLSNFEHDLTNQRFAKIKKMTEDAILNKSFVQEIEKRKCLYDYTCVDYSNKDLQEQSWQEISDIIGGTVDDCKSRWKNLRGGLTRYLNRPLTLSGTRHVKKYYLYDYMKFLLPFTRTRSRNNVGNKSSDNLNEFISQNESHGDVSTDLEMDLEENYNGNFQENQFYTNDTNHAEVDEDAVISKIPMQNEDPFGEAVKMYFARKLAKDQNPDLEFFKSILPDIADFSPSQKRRFKQKVLKAIDEVSQGT